MLRSTRSPQRFSLTIISSTLLLFLPTILFATNPPSTPKELISLDGNISPQFNFAPDKRATHCPSTALIGVDGGASRLNIKMILEPKSSKPNQAKTYSASRDTSGSVSHTPVETAKNLLDMIQTGLTQLTGSSQAANITCYYIGLGMSGFEDKPGVIRFFNELKSDQRLLGASLTSDAETLWLDAFSKKGEGIIVISGTGHIVQGKNKKGQRLQIGGLSSPSPDKPSARQLTQDYDDCIDQMTCFIDSQIKIINGKSLTIGENNFPRGLSGIPFLELERDKNNRTDFEQRTQFTVIERKNTKLYAARSAELIQFREKNKGQDYCIEYTWEKAKYDLLKLLNDLPLIPQFENVPFILFGSLALPLWDAIEPSQKSHLETLRVERKPDPLEGALQLARNIRKKQ